MTRGSARVASPAEPVEAVASEDQQGECDGALA